MRRVAFTVYGQGRRVLELGGDLSTPMFIHDPARPAVLDPNGDALRREIEALRCD